MIRREVVISSIPSRSQKNELRVRVYIVEELDLAVVVVSGQKVPDIGSFNLGESSWTVIDIRALVRRGARTSESPIPVSIRIGSFASKYASMISPVMSCSSDIIFELKTKAVSPCLSP